VSLPINTIIMLTIADKFMEYFVLLYVLDTVEWLQQIAVVAYSDYCYCRLPRVQYILWFIASSISADWLCIGVRR